MCIRDRIKIIGGPKSTETGQGGLLDVQLHPNFSKNKWIYFSYNKQKKNKYSTAVSRFILDNNKLTNEISSKKLCYVQAEEIFEYSLRKDFRNILINNSDELNINFLHFIYDFNHIRDPQYAAYNNMGRVYNKLFFTSTHAVSYTHLTLPTSDLV